LRIGLNSSVHFPEIPLLCWWGILFFCFITPHWSEATPKAHCGSSVWATSIRKSHQVNIGTQTRTVNQIILNIIQLPLIRVTPVKE
jgi:hypothetical protein